MYLYKKNIYMIYIYTSVFYCFIICELLLTLILIDPTSRKRSKNNRGLHPLSTEVLRLPYSLRDMVANPLGSHQQDLLKPQPLAFPPCLASNKNSVIVLEFLCRHVFKGEEHIIYILYLYVGLSLFPVLVALWNHSCHVGICGISKLPTKKECCGHGFVEYSGKVGI